MQFAKFVQTEKGALHSWITASQSALLLLCLIFSQFGLADTVDFRSARMKSLAKPFLGNFVQYGSFGESPALITAEDGELQWWYGFTNILSSSFRMPVEKIGQTETSRYRGTRGWTTVETTYLLSNKRASIEKVEYGRFWMSVQTQELVISGSSILASYNRRYFKRKFRIAGPWVPDTKSFDGLRNAKSEKFELIRISAQPLPFDKFAELISSQPKPNRKVLAAGFSDEDLPRILENRGVRISPNQPKHEAEIIDLQEFRRQRESCRSLLDPE